LAHTKQSRTWIGATIVIAVLGALAGLPGRHARRARSIASRPPLQGFQITLEDRNPWAENDGRLCDIHGARNGDVVVAQGEIPFTSPDQLLDAVSQWRDEYYTVIRGQAVLKLMPRGRAWTKCYRDITPVSIASGLAWKARAAMDSRHAHGAGAPIETGSGIWDLPPATRPRVYPADPYGGKYYEYYEGNAPAALYRNCAIRYLRFMEDRQLAVEDANDWVQHYVGHLASHGFTVLDRDKGEAIGVWIRWGARVVCTSPDPEWLFTSCANAVEIDVEFGYGQPDVWYKLEYVEYERLPDAMAQLGGQ